MHIKDEIAILRLQMAVSLRHLRRKGPEHAMSLQVEHSDTTILSCRDERPLLVQHFHPPKILMSSIGFTVVGCVKAMSNAWKFKGAPGVVVQVTAKLVLENLLSDTEISPCLHVSVVAILVYHFPLECFNCPRDVSDEARFQRLSLPQVFIGAQCPPHWMWASALVRTRKRARLTSAYACAAEEGGH